MIPSPPVPGPARPAAVVNEEIRALWTGPGAHPTVRLTKEQRERYERLCAELREIERGDVTTAA